MGVAFRVSHPIHIVLMWLAITWVLGELIRDRIVGTEAFLGWQTIEGLQVWGGQGESLQIKVSTVLCTL